MQQGIETSLLTTGEAAQRLGISRHTLLRAVERGEITPALRTPGGYLRFLPATVEAYAHRLSATHAPHAPAAHAVHARHRGRDEAPPSRRLCMDVDTTAPMDVDTTAPDETVRLLLAAAPLPAWVIDEQTLRFLAVNAAATTAYGYTCAEFLTLRLTDIWPEQDGPPLCDVLARSAAEPAHTGLWRLRRKDGAIVDVAVTARRLRFAGRPAVLVFAQDSRVRRPLEEAQRRDLPDAREAFLSAAAHDLKTPLASILGQTHLAQMRVAGLGAAQGAPVAASLAKIDVAARRMVRLVEAMGDVTHVGLGGALDLDRQPTDLDALVHAAVDGVRGLSPHEIRVEIAEAASALHGQVDAGRMERVVANLLDNAVKYAPDGGPITVRLTRGHGAAPEAVIAVQDQGVGIPEADLPHVFERFRRGGNAVGHFGGTGIGLASVRGIVEQHGGTVAVESQEGVGSTLTVRLPLDPP
jgi:excisionase family DNA binding protein/PAS domain S-box-containing protein